MPIVTYARTQGSGMSLTATYLAYLDWKWKQLPWYKRVFNPRRWLKLS